MGNFYRQWGIMFSAICSEFLLEMHIYIRIGIFRIEFSFCNICGYGVVQEQFDV